MQSSSHALLTRPFDFTQSPFTPSTSIGSQFGISAFSRAAANFKYVPIYQFSSLISRASHQSKKVTKSALLRSLSISLNKEDVDIAQLQRLLTACNQNCDLFPAYSHQGNDSPPSVKPVCIEKLRKAVKHSTVVVSAHVTEFDEDDGLDSHAIHPWWSKLTGETAGSNTRLVGFGRAYSDTTLTASIQDLVVDPSLNSFGIEKTVLNILVKELHRRHIIDISILATSQTRSFFLQQGFRKDAMGSTTMAFLGATSQPSGNDSSNKELAFVGCKSIKIPPPLSLPYKLRRPLGSPKVKDKGLIDWEYYEEVE